MASLSLLPPRPVRAPAAVWAVGTRRAAHGGPELALEPGGILCGRAETPPSPAPGAGCLHLASSSARRSAASRSDWAVATRVALEP